MMNRAKIFLLILGIAVIGGCASHGKKTMTAFQQEDIAIETLQKQVGWLKAVIAEGDTHEQFRAVKALRYQSKYSTDIEKRKLAIHGLIFVTAFSEDADVRSSARSRLTVIMNDLEEDFDLRLAVVDGKKNLVLGKAYYEEKDPSLFSNRMEINKVFPDEDHRDDALLFLIDHFETLEPEMQQHVVSAFEQILGNQPFCIEKADAGCAEYDKDDQDERKAILGKQITYWAMNDCDWSRDNLTPDIKEALNRLAKHYPDQVTGSAPKCAPFDPVTEDFTVLEMRSIKMPRNYWQFGVDLTDTPSNGIHASNLEFGIGNGRTYGIILGMNIDENWVEPLREKYMTIQYRPNNSNTIIGATRTIRTPDYSRNDSRSDDVDGAVDGDSKYVYGIDENELFVSSTIAFESIDSHMHLYLSQINQKLAFQYFFRPTFSFMLEASFRAEMDTKRRETDTIENEDRIERESEANDLENDILIGTKWNRISLLKPLFIGRTNRDGREGIFNFKLYYSMQREKTYFVVTSPF